MSTTSRRLPRSPVMQTFDPPLIIWLAVLENLRIVMDDRASPRIPQTRGEHMTWVKLSVINGSWGSSASMESKPWLGRMLELSRMGTSVKYPYDESHVTRALSLLLAQQHSQ